VVTVSLLFRYAPRRQQPGVAWLAFGAGLATALWWLISLLLAAYVTQSADFGATYGPLTGVMVARPMPAADRSQPAPAFCTRHRPSHR
jgi:uncharacterized BrkB/YihY/UPF0761 family membrane protein